MNPPADIRWQQRRMNFERALRLLREAMANGPEALNQLEKEGAIRESHLVAIVTPALKQLLKEIHGLRQQLGSADDHHQR